MFCLHSEFLRCELARWSNHCCTTQPRAQWKHNHRRARQYRFPTYHCVWLLCFPNRQVVWLPPVSWWVPPVLWCSRSICGLLAHSAYIYAIDTLRGTCRNCVLDANLPYTPLSLGYDASLQLMTEVGSWSCHSQCSSLSGHLWIPTQSVETPFRTGARVQLPEPFWHSSSRKGMS